MDPKSIKKYKYVGNTISEDDITFEEHKHNNEKLTAVSNNGNFGNIGNGNIFTCENCKKKYKTRNGLWKHNKTCNKDCVVIDKAEYKKYKSYIKTLQENFVCESCDYITDIKCNYLKHIKSKKHQKNENIKNTKFYYCDICEKKYKTRSGLWKHVSKCNINTQKYINDNKEKKDKETKELLEIFTNYIKNNQEIQKELIESNKIIHKIIPNIGNNNNNNNSNNSISINVFLNEHCKDAINFTEFIKNISVSIEDIMKTYQLGYTEGLSNILMKNLQNMEITKRPIHCTDNKRLKFFIKDEDKWEKDNGEKIEKAITVVSHKQIKEMNTLKNENIDNFNKEDKYVDFISTLIGPTADEEIKRNKKEIVKLVGKEVSLKDAMIEL
tara:strand:+ start:1505 stop:2653 length:1149 start_codon:yes stop_codon:yes gene_type:complete